MRIRDLLHSCSFQNKSESCRKVFYEKIAEKHTKHGSSHLEVFSKKGILKNSVKFTGNMSSGIFFNKVSGWSSATYSKRNFDTSVFLWNF